jgi:FkbM family methyltransferase
MADYIALNTLYDQQTAEIMRRTLAADSTCVDVGCHSGGILREMLQYAPQGAHYAFEPIPALYQYLVATFPNVKLFNLALSNVSGETTFQHVTSNPGYSGLKQRRYDRPDETIEQIQVRTELLDHIVPADVTIRLMKIDVEGAELQVLEGGGETVRRCRPIVIFEHGLGASDHYGTTPEQIFAFFEARAMLVSSMGRYLEGAAALSRSEFSGQFYNGENFYFMAYPAS